VTTYVCSNCGELNAPGATFCVNCRSFLAWDEELSPASMRPEWPEVEPAESTESRLQITSKQKVMAVPATGEPATLTLQVTNTALRS
jgi:predicted ATP-dependent serine protease